MNGIAATLYINHWSNPQDIFAPCILMLNVNQASFSVSILFVKGLFSLPIAQLTLHPAHSGIIFSLFTLVSGLLYFFLTPRFRKWIANYQGIFVPEPLDRLPIRRGFSIAFTSCLGIVMMAAIAMIHGDRGHHLALTAAYLGVILFSLGTAFFPGVMEPKLRQFWQKTPQIGRDELLSAIRQEITERSQQSLHRAVFNTLMFDPHQETETPRLWNVDIKIGQNPTRTLSPTEKIIDAFPNQNHLGRVILLGMSGSGKTTTLLELAADFCDRALENPQVPIPVLLDLPTWPSSQPLTTWVCEQLQTKYGVSFNLSELWLKNGQLFLLLDGLDELKPSDQETCVAALNQLTLSNGRSPSFLVSTRLDCYKKTRNRLKLSAAIGLKNIDIAQIKNYLLASRSREFWENIKDNPHLLALAKNPLFLNLMVLANEEILIHSWKRITAKSDRIDYLFNAYIRRQLSRQTPSQSYPPGKEPTPDRTKTWLKSLVMQTSPKQQIEFSLDSLPKPLFQPNIELIYLTINLILPIGLCGLYIYFYTKKISLIPGIVILGTTWLFMLLFLLSIKHKIFLGKIIPPRYHLFSAINTIILFGLGLLSIRLNWLIIAQAEGQIGGLLYGLSLLIFTIAIAPLLGLIPSIYAAFPCLKPLYIHWNLARNGRIPWNYARFLDFLTERLFLQKIRGHYRFIHPLFTQHLQNHFD